jgi:ATP/ADP translocase
MVALFWSFTNSLMDLEQAKGAYGLIICFAQVGAITGSTLATHAAEMGIPKLFLVASVSIMSVSLLIKVYHIVFRDNVTRQVHLIST